MIAFTFLLIGCGGSGGMQAVNGPSWYTGVEGEDPGFLYGKANAKSSDMQLAIDKATADARSQVAQAVKVRVDDDTKTMKQEAGQQDSMDVTKFFSEASELIASETLSGSTVDKQETFKDGGIYSSFVRVKYNKSGVDASLVQKVKDDQEMYARFRAQQAFKDLQDSVDKMKQQEGNK
jgi:hypothetical protein